MRNRLPREKLNEAVSIRELKRYAARRDTARSWLENYLKPLAGASGKKAAVIGGGPCGLTAAFYLRKKGHDVTVYERLPIAGGMLAAGIPAYRLPGYAAQEEIDIIKQAGVVVKTGRNIASAAELKKDYDAVLVAVGADRGKKTDRHTRWDSEDVYTCAGTAQAHRLGQPYGRAIPSISSAAETWRTTAREPCSGWEERSTSSALRKAQTCWPIGRK